MKKLNFGSGKSIKQGFINVDLHPYEGINESFDFEKFPYPFKDNTFDYIETKQVMEHLENTLEVLQELHRIMKPHTILHIEVPYFRSISAFAITHKKFFSVQMFKIITGEINASSKINQKLFKIKRLKLKFRKSYRLLGIGIFANKFPHLYEDFLGHIFPAGDIIIDFECLKK